MIARASVRRFLTCTLAAAIALHASACGDDRTRREGSPRADAADSGRQSPLESASDSATAIVSPLANACFEGDPATGTPWRLVGEDSSWSELPTAAIEDLVTRDSARLAARLTSAADALPNDTTGGDFSALPVVVQAAWRILAADGDTILVARTVRRLPIESAPREETTLLVAVPAVRAGTRATLAVLWSSREVGAEEAADPLDLAVAREDGNGPLLLFVRSADDPPRAELLVRRDSAWTAAWRGSLPRCARP